MAYGAAGVYGALIALPSMVALYFYLRLITRVRRYEVITGKAYRPRDVDLGVLKWPALGFVFLYMLLAVGLPLLALIWASLLPYLQMPSADALGRVTLSNYRDLLLNLGGMAVVRNTFLLMISVSIIVVFFSFMTSWVVVRTQFRFRKTMDVIAMLPHAVPGLAFAFALGMLGIFASRWLPWLPFAGTVAIIAVAHVVNRLSYGTRVMNAALVQLQRELQEAGQVCGAKQGTIMWRIVVPLIKPSLVFAALWTALLSASEVTMALFLAESSNRLVSVGIWFLWQGGNLGIAAAGGVVMVVAMGALSFFVLRLSGGALLEPRRGARREGGSSP